MTEFIPTAFVTGIACIVVCVLCAISLIVLKLAKRHPKHEPAIAIALFLLLMLSVVGTIWHATMYQTGAEKGMTMDDWKTRNVVDITVINDRTPDNQELPEERNGAFVVLYKYGCTDCEAIYDDLGKAIQDAGVEDVYYVASSSEDGRQLIEDGDIDYVPTGIYLRHEPLANGASMNHIPLATVDGNETVVDTAALARLALLQERQK